VESEKKGRGRESESGKFSRNGGDSFAQEILPKNLFRLVRLVRFFVRGYRAPRVS